MFFVPSKSRQTAKIWNIGVSKTSDHIQIIVEMMNPTQEPPKTTQAQIQNFKDIDVLSTFKIMIESQNMAHWCIKDQ